MEKVSVSVEEFAKSMGISRAMAYRIANMKDFPTIRIGRRMCISVEGLKRWMDEHVGQQIEGVKY